jgi:kanamycin kinase
VTFPTGAVTVPDVVTRIAAGRPADAVWVNELGGVTFRVGDGYVKTYPAEHAALLADEAVRLRWAGRFTAVPEVTAARAIGAGLRHLHDALPVDECPFGRPSWVPLDAPPADRLVVCHGDACAPNTLMTDDGSFSGHVDLGDLGVADRWADLAIATMSLDWNYPSGDFTAELLEAYGVTVDTERVAYYRRVWD